MSETPGISPRLQLSCAIESTANRVGYHLCGIFSTLAIAAGFDV